MNTKQNTQVSPCYSQPVDYLFTDKALPFINSDNDDRNGYDWFGDSKSFAVLIGILGACAVSIAIYETLLGMMFESFEVVGALIGVVL